MINLTPINSMMIAGNATELVHDVITLDDATTVKDHDEVWKTGIRSWSTIAIGKCMLSLLNDDMMMQNCDPLVEEIEVTFHDLNQIGTKTMRMKSSYHSLTTLWVLRSLKFSYHLLIWSLMKEVWTFQEHLDAFKSKMALAGAFDPVKCRVSWLH